MSTRVQHHPSFLIALVSNLHLLYYTHYKMALPRLTLTNINQINATGTLLPFMEPTETFAAILSCPICLEFKHDKMISHLNCRRLTCTECVLNLIANDSSCPICRSPCSNYSSPLYTKASPIEQQFIDSCDYICDNCDQVMKLESAKIHHRSCPRGQPHHQPPSHIPTRGVGPLVRRELVSNPISPSQTYSDRRLLVLHHNGNQVVSKFFTKYSTARMVKAAIAELSGADPSTLKLFKFVHAEVKDEARVWEFATSNGANYMSSFTNFDSLAERSANIILQELGPPPRVETPHPNNWTFSGDWD